jgi:protein-S-isoprenylcysteine O-methyltransferase Ste14
MMSSRSQAVASWTVPAVFTIAAASTGVHTAASVSEALAHSTARAWLLALYALLRTGIVTAFAVFTVGRRKPKRLSRSPLAFAACAVAVAAVLAFASPNSETPEAYVIAGDALAVAFSVWLLVSVLSLGRNFGVLPEARGLVTRGPYRLVRHPVYLGELGACTGLALAAASIYNVFALAALMVAQGVRMVLEERALVEAFPDYRRYASDTPRLVPRWRPSRASHGSGDASSLVDDSPIVGPETAVLPEPAYRT